MENSAYMFAGVLCFYFGMAFIISSIIRNKPANKTRGQYHEELELTDRVYVGNYLGGLTAEEVQAPFVHCIITKDHFVFCRGRQGTEIGRVPRASVNKVAVTPLAGPNQIMSSAMVAAKNLRSKANGYCLAISWRGRQGAQHEAVFQFTDGRNEEKANETAEKLSFWCGEKLFARQTEEGSGTKIIACEST